MLPLPGHDSSDIDCVEIKHIAVKKPITKAGVAERDAHIAGS
jgi:hypothetical protein